METMGLVKVLSRKTVMHFGRAAALVLHHRCHCPAGRRDCSLQMGAASGNTDQEPRHPLMMTPDYTGQRDRVRAVTPMPVTDGSPPSRP